jgi:MFS family permease
MHPARAYFLFNFLVMFGVCLPTVSYTPFLFARGLSFAEVALVNAVFFAAIVLAEVPTGLLADGHSRVWSLRVGAAVKAVACLGYMSASGFASAVFWEFLCGIGCAFVSGADQAWMTDALIRRGEKDRLGKVLASASMWQSLGALAGGTASAFLAAVDLRLGWAASSAALALACAVACRRMNGDGEPAVRLTEGEAFRASLAALRASSGLKWAVAAAMVSGLVLPFNYGWSPFYGGRVGSYGMAVVWVALYSSLVVTGWFIRRGELRPGVESWSIPLALALSGVGMAAIGMFGGLALPLAAGAVHEIGRGAFQPLIGLFVQRRVESGYRATYGSLQSLLGRLGFAAVLVVTWALLRGLPTASAAIVTSWVWAGSVMTALSFVLWLIRPRQ